MQKNFIKLDPWFITGFTDAEGCFSLSILKTKERKVGWRVKPVFQIDLHKKDQALLQQIQSYFCGVGNVYKHGPQSSQFRVESVKDLKVIIHHFYKYPLITQKFADYKLFKEALKLIEQKEHLTEEGLCKIIAIKGSMNLGLSEELKAAFPGIIPVERPSVYDILIRDPNWLAGFTSGEGSFKVKVINSPSHRLEFQVQLVFTLTQHERDMELMRSLVNYLDCGNVYQNRETVDFEINKFTDLTNKVIPFFNKYTLHGVKRLDYLDWGQVAKLMQNKEHLTQEGLSKISELKAGMNKGRLDGNSLVVV